jgi:hypothetical protein
MAGRTGDDQPMAAPGGPPMLGTDPSPQGSIVCTALATYGLPPAVT